MARLRKEKSEGSRVRSSIKRREKRKERKEKKRE